MFVFENDPWEEEKCRNKMTEAARNPDWNSDAKEMKNVILSPNLHLSNFVPLTHRPLKGC